MLAALVPATVMRPVGASAVKMVSAAVVEQDLSDRPGQMRPERRL